MGSQEEKETNQMLFIIAAHIMLEVNMQSPCNITNEKNAEVCDCVDDPEYCLKKGRENFVKLKPVESKETK